MEKYSLLAKRALRFSGADFIYGIDWEFGGRGENFKRRRRHEFG
jgi:hypothetical protein